MIISQVFFSRLPWCSFKHQHLHFMNFVGQMFRVFRQNVDVPHLTWRWSWDGEYHNTISTTIITTTTITTTTTTTTTTTGATSICSLIGCASVRLCMASNPNQKLPSTSPKPAAYSSQILSNDTKASTLL